MYLVMFVSLFLSHVSVSKPVNGKGKQLTFCARLSHGVFEPGLGFRLQVPLHSFLIKNVLSDICVLQTPMCVLQPAEQPLVRALFMGDLWGRVKYRKTCFLFCTPGSCLLTLSLSIKSRKWIFFSFTSGENHAVRVPLFSFLLKQIVYSQT